eukprot:gene5948-12002_t
MKIFLCLIFAVASCPFIISVGQSVPGGYGEFHRATLDEQNILNSVKPAVQIELGHTFNIFTALEYKRQIVAGTNYLMKVLVDDDQILFVKIFVPLPYLNLPPQLSCVTAGHTITDDFSDPCDY